ncbi:Protein SGT1 A, partial [Lunasporangiospora selenospora]
MTSVQDLFALGSHAFADEDYGEALSFYTKAIEISATHVEIFLKRSATFQKLGRDKEAYQDALKALELITEKPYVDINIEAKAHLRKGVSAFHLQDYQTAKVALETCHTLSPNQRTLANWMRKNEQELAKRAKGIAAASTLTLGASTPSLTTPTIQRVRHEWFQNDSTVSICIFIKNVKEENAKVIITARTLSVTVRMPTGSDYSLELETLSHNVVPAESKYEILSTKIEIQLRKERFGIKWGALEGDDSNAGSMANIGGSSAPIYPSSSRKAKNWDALEREAAMDEEKADGDKALNQLFAQIYKDADDDTRRAMMKSFTESNGTCLSTNWDEVSKGTVETRPPEGMVARK